MRNLVPKVGPGRRPPSPGMYVTLQTFVESFRRKAFTQHFEYPEQPVPVRPRTAASTAST